MKIAAVLEDALSAGGGFSQALNAILQIQRLSVAEGQASFEVTVWTTREENLSPLRQLGLPARLLRVSARDRLLSRLEISQVGRRVVAKAGIEGGFERTLRSDGSDIIYFPAPSAFSLGLKKLNYITTVWDLCHRDHPEFPEVRSAAEFEAREWLYRHSLARAYVVLTDSAPLSERIERSYGIDARRTLIMPFGPSPFLASASSWTTAHVLAHHALEPGYFFYPAQFWAHKNHVRIVEALALLRDRRVTARAVFAGGDKGNLNHVRARARALGVESQVNFLGFVPGEHLQGLYGGCAGVVMPTYFGPTNLPPLEAWAAGKPLIYSLECEAQAGDAALLVDPDDARTLADTMHHVLTSADADADLWRERGRARLAAIDAERAAAEADLRRRLEQFALRRACWD